MPSHVALLRAINVAGHGMISMADLRAKFAAAGFKDAQTLLQSGNVVFSGKGKPAQMEKAIEAKVGTDVLVRTAADVQKVLAANPFPAEAKSDPGRLVVMFLKDAPDAVFEWPGPERMKLAGRELYVVYPNGQGKTKLTGALIEKRFGTRGTARNWNTVTKLAAMLTA